MAFKETVDRLRAAGAEPDAPGDVVARWQGEVGRLFDRIDDWLKPFVADGSIELRRRSKAAYEERTGAYEIEQLDIEVGPETVRLDPKATVVIGARGRIDVSHLGTGDPLMLVLTETDTGQGWSLVDPAERGRLTPLDRQSFEATLDRLLAAYGPGPGPAV